MAKKAGTTGGLTRGQQVASQSHLRNLPRYTDDSFLAPFAEALRSQKQNKLWIDTVELVDDWFVQGSRDADRQSWTGWGVIVRLTKIGRFGVGSDTQKLIVAILHRVETLGECYLGLAFGNFLQVADDPFFVFDFQERDSLVRLGQALACWGIRYDPDAPAETKPKSRRKPPVKK